MDRMVKVFCTGRDQDRLAETHRAIERYEGFVLASVPKRALDALARRYPVEDITDLYTIRCERQAIDTSRPRLDAKGCCVRILPVRGPSPCREDPTTIWCSSSVRSRISGWPQ
jgi:hypothetical protein